MRLPFSAVISSVALTLACQSPPPTSDAAPAAASTTAKDEPGAPANPSEAALVCEAAPLEAELQSFCAFDLGVPALELAKVAWTAPSYHPLATRVITLDSRGLTDPEGTGTVSIQAWLADPPRRIPEPGEMVLAIAHDVPATTVAELQRGLSANGRKEVKYLVHVTDEAGIPQPRDPKMLDKIGDELPVGSNERVVFVAQAVQGYAEVCPPIAGVFPQLEQVSSGERCDRLGTLAAAAIVECGCDELPVIMTLLYALTVGFEPPPGRAAAVPVFLDPSYKLIPPVGATWGEIVAKSFEDDQLKRLWIEAVAEPIVAAP